LEKRWEKTTWRLRRPWSVCNWGAEFARAAGLVGRSGLKGPMGLRLPALGGGGARLSVACACEGVGHEREAEEVERLAFVFGTSQSPKIGVPPRRREARHTFIVDCDRPDASLVDTAD
jgi:hypothetical protein